jgi:hypothetical protein
MFSANVGSHVVVLGPSTNHNNTHAHACQLNSFTSLTALFRTPKQRHFGPRQLASLMDGSVTYPHIPVRLQI